MITSETWVRTCNKAFYPDDENFKIEPDDVICLHSWFALEFFKKIREIPFPIKLVTVTGDAPLNAVIDEERLFKLLDMFPNIVEWKIMQSWYSHHPRIKHVQLGPARTDIDPNLQHRPKKNAVYYNFTVSNKYERLMMPNSPTKSFEEYLEEMAGYKYAMCPMGVGADTHKFYEAVAVGCIPIIKVPEKFLKTYEGYNYVCLPGLANCSYILGAAQATESCESVYVPERTDIQNGLHMLDEPKDIEFRITSEQAKEIGTKINSYGEYFKKSGILPPPTSIIDHYNWLVQNKKCHYGGMSFFV